MIIVFGLLGTCLGCGLLVTALSSGGDIGLGDAVAIIRVEGVIMTGRPQPGLASGGAYSEQIVEYIRRAKDDRAVKAIVLRINSPGGSVVASDEIHAELLTVDKPIVVSMGELAASGGYYVAAPAEAIYANPHTLTGSIGVIAQLANVEGLMDKLGLKVIVIKSGPLKDEGSPFREMTEEERAIWQAIIDEAYQGFVDIVASGRNLPVDEVKKLADGRVYTGQQALALGLVDELGNLQDAIDKAAELGGIQGQPRLIEYRRPPSLLESLLGTMTQRQYPFDLDELLDLEARPSLQYLYVGP